ncbi:S-adenosyl-L-methionine-dependent methyltransferase [Collybia nuda]|uniref:S-adenosyl-L-methionine-dependent methyltransferase n=1 Tax=Collybia nuda TaxID=64659 RepID=A0A9P5XYU1_9AGAR|nr:S-adenosyl-L-methionine-dependent methyltransferase [Collybia nuda]
MTLKPSNDRYLFRNNARDNHRLDRQFHIYQKFFDKGPVTLAGFLDEKRVNKVLDVAAGSLAWTLDVARSTDPSMVELHACDIAADNFPPTSVIDAFSINAFIHDATQPFPEEMKGQFDVVNMRLLVYAFSEDQWKKALKNICEVLRPGGHLFLFDYDIIWFNGAETDPKLTAPWLSSLNRMFLKQAQATGYVISLSESLPNMLAEASFAVKEQVSCRCPFGMTAKTCLSVNGASLAGDEDFTGEMAQMITTRLSTGALAGGYLEDDSGKPITTEAGRLQWIEKYNKEIGIHGVTIQGTQITAIRV